MSSRLNKTNGKGFTLIEVVLVLAIGGLIFLLAFIAFRNASINRRDGQRRAEASRFIAEMNNYLGDRGATTPPQTQGEVEDFVKKYMDDNWVGPSGKVIFPVTSEDQLDGPSNTRDSTYFYTVGSGSAGCDAGTTLGPRDFKIQIGLEKGIACRDSL